MLAEAPVRKFISSVRPSIPAPIESPDPPPEEAWDKRHSEAYRMKMKGTRISTIAKLFNVTERTIHRWHASHIDEFRKSFESQPAANLIAEQLADIKEIENQCLQEATSSGCRRDKYSFLRAALTARQMAIDLMLKTGVLPKQPERLYSTVIDEKIKVGDGVVGDERTREELKESIVELLRHPRTLA